MKRYRIIGLTASLEHVVIEQIGGVFITDKSRANNIASVLRKQGKFKSTKVIEL